MNGLDGRMRHWWAHLWRHEGRVTCYEIGTRLPLVCRCDWCGHRWPWGAP